MPCLSTSGILVPAGTVNVLPSATELDARSFGCGGGSLRGVMGPSICCARSELEAKTTSAIRNSMRHLAKSLSQFWVQQVLATHLPEGTQRISPARDDALGILSPFQLRQFGVVGEQRFHLGDLKLLRIKMEQRRSQFDPERRRVYRIALDDGDIHTVANCSGKSAGYGRKVRRFEANTSELAGIQVFGKSFSVDPRCADLLERKIRPTANGDIGLFEQGHTGIKRFGIHVAQGRRWIYPRDPGFVEPLVALPTLHGNNPQLRLDLSLTVEESRQLAERHTVADRKRMIVHERSRGGRDRSLHGQAIDWIGAVEHDHLDSCCRARLEKIAKGGLIGIKARAGV